MFYHDKNVHVSRQLVVTEATCKETSWK